MTKSEMHLHDLAFLGPGLLFLDQYFNSFIDEYLVLWIALVSTHKVKKSILKILVVIMVKLLERVNLYVIKLQNMLMRCN